MGVVIVAGQSRAGNSSNWRDKSMKEGCNYNTTPAVRKLVIRVEKHHDKGRSDPRAAQHRPGRMSD
jgi:hypothetical protein